MLSRKSLAFGFLFLVALASLVFLAQNFEGFAVKYILVNHVEASESLRKTLLEGQENVALYSLDLEKITRVLQRLYVLERVSIKKTYPHTLLIEISDADILAYVHVHHDTAHKLFGLNQQGQIVHIVSDSLADSLLHDYPIISIQKIKNTEYSRHWQHKQIEELFQQESEKSIIETLGLLKNLHKAFYKQIKSISIHTDKLHNDMILRHLPMRFCFGEHLTLKHFLYIIALEDDLKTNKAFRFLDLRFDTVIARY